MAVTTTSAMAMATSLMRVLMTTTTSATVAKPTRVVGRSALPMCPNRSTALSTLFA